MCLKSINKILRLDYYNCLLFILFALIFTLHIYKIFLKGVLGINQKKKKKSLEWRLFLFLPHSGYAKYLAY